MSRTKKDRKPSLPRHPVPPPTKPHKVKKGGKPKFEKSPLEEWDGEGSFYDNFIDGNGR